MQTEGHDICAGPLLPAGQLFGIEEKTAVTAVPTDSQSTPASKAPLTLVFTDMVGSSAAKRALSLGDDAGTRDSAFIDAIQSRHLALVRECVTAHGGKEIMTLGDGFFLTFEDPRAAILCSAEIQMRLQAKPIMTANGPMKLRIGLHVGTPKYFEGSWHGTDVDTAARAESAASPDQIVVTEAARKYLGEMDGILLRPLGTFALRGVGEIRLWDADYSAHGLRKASLLSLEEQRRQKRMKVAWRAGLAAASLALIAVAYYGLRARGKTVITDKDKIILADFDNKTGDPVFDSTLKEALSIQLDQSPYLQLVGDQELHADLRYLNQPIDQRITPALARELGQREGIKAYIAASVASLGTSYVISIDAVNCATGDAIARTQAEAPDKMHVLTAVSTAASNLRAGLGESLASIQKLSSPFMDVTTSSLDAFHAFSLGEDAHRKGFDPEATVFYRQAVDFDPNFAMAYARLGVVEANAGAVTKEAESLGKAYELRQHVTERERLYIAAQLNNAKGDIPGSIEAWQRLLTAYPKDPSGLNNLGISYGSAGEAAKSAVYYKKVVETAAWDVAASDNLAGALLCIDQPTEAKKYIDGTAAVSAGADTQMLSNQAIYAFETGDLAWKNYLGAGASRPDGYSVDQSLSDILYMQGALTAGRAEALHGAQHALQVKVPDAAGNLLATAAMEEAELGDCSQAPTLAKKALVSDTSIQTLPAAALALALCGQGQAESSALKKLAAVSPDNTLLNMVYLPEVEAAIALHQHRPQAVASLLESAQPYPLASLAPLLEAEAFLALHRPADALNALQPALRYRYIETALGSSGPQAPSYEMATLLTARAQAMSGDKNNAIKSYQKSLEFWKNADPDFPALIAAKKEYAALQ